MDEPPELRRNRHWRTAVWALRLGYLALVVAIAGVIAMTTVSTPWVLTTGVVMWLVAAAVTLIGFFRARHELSEPRPGYWAMRLMLVSDTVHALPPVQQP